MSWLIQDQDPIIFLVGRGRKGTWGGSRKGAGRPPTLKGPVDRWVRLEKEDVDEAEQVAAMRGISFSELIRRALRGYLKRQKRR